MTAGTGRQTPSGPELLREGRRPSRERRFGSNVSYTHDNVAAEDSFWVFTTSYDGDFGAEVYGAVNPISAFGLHEASGGLFGEVIEPSFEEVGGRGPFKEWPAVAGGVYVLHVSLERGGFF